MNSSPHSFDEDLKWSESQHNADWWTPYYRRAFPDHKTIEHVRGRCAAQLAGVDKFVVFPNGKKISIDEKIRRTRQPDDIAIEFKHVRPDGTSWPGWIAKPNQFTDYLAYGFVKFQIAFFFPFQSLRTAWLKHSQEWQKRFQIPPSQNRDYQTYNVAVPTDILMGCLLDAMRVQL